MLQHSLPNRSNLPQARRSQPIKAAAARPRPCSRHLTPKVQAAADLGQGTSSSGCPFIAATSSNAAPFTDIAATATVSPEVAKLQGPGWRVLPNGNTPQVRMQPCPGVLPVGTSLLAAHRALELQIILQMVTLQPSKVRGWTLAQLSPAHCSSASALACATRGSVSLEWLAAL